MFSFQTGASIAKTLFPVLGPAGTVALRTGIATLILLAIWRPFRTPADGRVRLTGAVWRAILPYGISLGCTNYLFYQSIARIPLGIAVAIEFIGPLAVAIIGSRRPIDLLWAALATGGFALIGWPQGHVRLDPVGVAFALGAALGWGNYIVTGVRLGRVLDAGPGVALGLMVSAVVVVPLGIASLGPIGHTPALLIPAAGIAVLSSALPYTLELAAMRRMTARGFGLLMSLEPAVAGLTGLVLLNEAISPRSWIAILAISAASAGSVIAGDRRAPAEPPTG